MLIGTAWWHVCRRRPAPEMNIHTGKHDVETCVTPDPGVILFAVFLGAAITIVALIAALIAAGPKGPTGVSGGSVNPNRPRNGHPIPPMKSPPPSKK